VDYNSEAPLVEEAGHAAVCHLGETGPTTGGVPWRPYAGARLEVRSGNGPQLTGKLFERGAQNAHGCRSPAGPVETDEISLITESGEVRSVDLEFVKQVCGIAEKDLQLEVGRYLGLIASSRDPGCAPA